MCKFYELLISILVCSTEHNLVIYVKLVLFGKSFSTSIILIKTTIYSGRRVKLANECICTLQENKIPNSGIRRKHAKMGASYLISFELPTVNALPAIIDAL